MLRNRPIDGRLWLARNPRRSRRGRGACERMALNGKRGSGPAGTHSAGRRPPQSSPHVCFLFTDLFAFHGPFRDAFDSRAWAGGHSTGTRQPLRKNAVKLLAHAAFLVAAVRSKRQNLDPVQAEYGLLEPVASELHGFVFVESGSVDLDGQQGAARHGVVDDEVDGRRRTDELSLALAQKR